MKTLLLYTLILFSCSTNNNPKSNGTITGKVIKIVDGNTFDILIENQTTMRIRLNGIDCTERRHLQGDTEKRND